MVDYVKTGAAGSVNELPSACFIDGDKANQVYGVPLRKFNGPCPNCKFPISMTLAFNPTDQYFYICFCPVCGKVIRYCDFDGNLADYAVMTSQKTTPLDVDEDIPSQYGPSY